VRCHAYQLPSDGYRAVEAQILEQLRDGDREQLVYLLTDHDLEVELLSGEWPVLFAAAEEFYQVVDMENGIARMAISPEELADFVALLRDKQRQDSWGPLAFGLAELADALPADCDLVGVAFVEESDDWQWEETVFEMLAIRPEVFALLEPHLRARLEAGHFRALGRLASDHCEGAIEFSPEQWRVLLRHAQERVPELLPVFEARIAEPSDYTSIREALMLISDPSFQPSLDAWLRVHASTAQYALLFRDANVERGIAADDADPDMDTIVTTTPLAPPPSTETSDVAREGESEEVDEDNGEDAGESEEVDEDNGEDAGESEEVDDGDGEDAGEGVDKEEDDGESEEKEEAEGEGEEVDDGDGEDAGEGVDKEEAEGESEEVDDGDGEDDGEGVDKEEAEDGSARAEEE
jgi:hypothetical protein